MSEFQAWINKLNAMTVAEIHDFMVQEEVTGEIGESEHCVISNFLTKKLDGEFNVTLGNTAKVDATLDWEKAEHSDSVKIFIYEFDVRHFPDLIG